MAATGHPAAHRGAVVHAVAGGRLQARGEADVACGSVLSV